MTERLDATTTTASLRMRWWYIAVPLAFVGLINMMDRTAIGVVMADKQFLQDLKLVGRPAVTGLLMSGFMLTYGLSPVVWGYVMKWCGPRVLAITGIIIWAATMALSGTAQTAGALITARVILGIGEGFAFPVANVFVANWFLKKERGRANSVWLSGMNLGPVVAGVLVAALVGAWGWRMAFYGLGALSLLIPLPLLIFLMRDRPGQHPRISAEEVRIIEEGREAKETEGPKAKEKQGYLGNYRFWLVAVAWGFSTIYFWGWATWMPTYFRTARHFSFQAAGYLYSLNYLFTLVSVLGFGYLSDRLMRRALFGGMGFVVGGVLMFLGGSIIGNPYWSLGALVFSLACQQVGFLMFHPLMQAIVPAESLSRAVGLGAFTSFLMGMISPTFVGFLLQISGFGAVIFYLALAAVIAGFLILLLVREGY